MNINWVYFSDTNTPSGEIKKILEKRQFTMSETNQIERLQNLLVEDNQTVLFIKAGTLFNVFELCQEISVQFPHVYIILIVPDNMENLKKAMLMGASDSLRSSYKLEELKEAIDHAVKYMDHRAKKDNSFGNLIKGKGRVIAISNPKGGVGRTVLTVNLAAAFARMGKRVAVIDANLQFGDVAMYNNLQPKRTIYEWVKEGYGHSNSIQQYMTVNEANVAILAAPPRPEFFEGILEVHLKSAIEEVQKIYDLILIDMPAHLSEIHLRCLDLSDEILLLTVNDLSILRISKLYLETLETINLKEKVKLVLNRYLKGNGLEHRKMEEILGMKVFYTLPEQVNIVSSSIKAGQPFILSNSRSQLGKSVWGLAERLVKESKAEPVSQKKERRWFLLGK